MLAIIAAIAHTPSSPPGRTRYSTARWRKRRSCSPLSARNRAALERKGYRAQLLYYPFRGDEGLVRSAD
jgi:hypothetical protein